MLSNEKQTIWRTIYMKLIFFNQIISKYNYETIHFDNYDEFIFLIPCKSVLIKNYFYVKLKQPTTFVQANSV